MKLLHGAVAGLIGFMAITAARGQTAATTQSAVNDQPTTVHFVIDARKDVHPISRYIYGVNHTLDATYPHLTLTRLGGNRWTCYNWTNNASNAGNDWHFQNDGYLGHDDVPGSATAAAIDSASNAQAVIILTIPMIGYVSADKNGDGDVRNSGADYLTTRFRRSEPVKGAPFTLTPDPQSPVVYQDEFVNWVKAKYPYCLTDPLRPIFFSLDNEPAIWAETHAEAHPSPLTYEELVERSVAYANAIKDVLPETKIFGPADYGWHGFVTLQDAPDAAKNGDFLNYYLKRMKLAESIYGRRLLDALDVHWYPEARAGNVRIIAPDATPEVAAVRLQAPRSLWDATYVENSWIARSIRGPIALIPRLLGKIHDNYPGTLLSLSEYNYGGGADISGGIAQADALGIFGRYGVFAACQWPLSRHEPFVAAAFAMYRNFDGKGAAFGDTSISATTDDVVGTSVYASVDSKDPNRVVIVAINKTDHLISANVTMWYPAKYRQGQVFQLTAAAVTPKEGFLTLMLHPGRFGIPMPPMSVSTVEFKS
ncbi:MAG: glycoside hydrolase family 44 protein [Tepidisphaeraceae bacterium]